MTREELTDIFSTLGSRLSGGVPSGTLREALRANPLFTEHSIGYALSAICATMLHRGRYSEWISRQPEPADSGDVGVIMAGNIPLAGFADMLYTVSSGHRCLYRPSSRDTALADWAAQELNAAAGKELCVRMGAGDRLCALIASGSDSTVSEIRDSGLAPRMLLRGSMHSVALLNGDELPQDEAQALCGDILLHGGLGCRSVSMILAPARMSLAPLHEALSASEIPLSDGYTGSYRQNRALCLMTGRKAADTGRCLLIESDTPCVPPGCVGILRYRSWEEALDWLSARISTLQCVVSSRMARIDAIDAAVCRPGTAQTPRLDDYPDRRNVMEFLHSS